VWRTAVRELLAARRPERLFELADTGTLLPSTSPRSEEPRLAAAMTQVLTCLTPSVIAQVSDRRLTWMTGPNRGTVADNNRNKMVVVFNRLTIGDSGIAQIRLRETNEWIVDTRNVPCVFDDLQHRVISLENFSSESRPRAEAISRRISTTCMARNQTCSSFR
jgi:hypothetical protein